MYSSFQLFSYFYTFLLYCRIGAQCHSTDVDLAKSLARKIMYYEYKMDYNTPIPIVHEAEVISRETRKKHGSHEKAKAFEDLLGMFYVAESFYMESKKDFVIKPYPVSYNHLIPDEDGKELVLVEIANIIPEKNGSVKKISEDFKALTSFHVAVLKVGDEWDIWIGKDVSKDVAAKAKSVVVNITIKNEDDVHESQMFGRNVRLTRQGKEPIMFKALFTDDCFPALEPPIINTYNKNEDSCKSWTYQLMNCFVPSGSTAAKTSVPTTAPSSSSQIQSQTSTEIQTHQTGELGVQQRVTQNDNEQEIYSLNDTFVASGVGKNWDLDSRGHLRQPEATQDERFVAPTTVNSKFWMRRQKSHIETVKAKEVEIIEEEKEEQDNPRRLNAVYLDEVEIEGNKVSLDSEVLGQLTEENKEEIALKIDPFKVVPQLNIRTDHARHIVTMATTNPSFLVGWQIEMGHKGLRVVMNARKSYSCGGLSFGGCKFEVLEGKSSTPEWVRLKLKPTSKGYAVKVLRKTALCVSEENNESQGIAEEGEEE